MSNDFSKSQGVLNSALQILPVDNLKRYRMQPVTGTESTWNKRSGTSVHSFILPSIPRFFLDKTKLTTYNSTSATAQKNVEAESIMETKKLF
jgi:hypothetical protein